MRGGDQSANLGGMLSQIGETVGGMGKAFDPITKAATKPRGDMEDPAHLQNLAQWATHNGDAAAASMYMSQAREAKAEQKEAKNLEYNANTSSIAADGTKRAGEGDVTNLDRNIAMLQERVANATTTQQQAIAQRALEAAQGSRKGAVGVQTQNHAKAVTAIDAQLESGVDSNGNPVDQRALDAIRDRRAELLKNPEVQDTLNAEAVARGKAEREQLALDGEKYLSKNVGSLREAVTTGDFDKIDDIVQDADGYRAQQAVRAFADGLQRESEAADERKILDETQVVYDYEMIEEQVADLDPTLLEAAGYNEAIRRVEESEGNRIGGKLTIIGHLTQASKARKAVTEAIAKARQIQAEAKYTKDLRAGEEDATEIDDLEASLTNYQPSDIDVGRRYTQLSRSSTVSRDSEGSPKFPEKIYAQAEAELRNEHATKVNTRLSQLGVESEEPEAPEGSYVSESGQSLMPNEVSEFIADEGEKAFKSAARAMGFSTEAITEMLRKDAPEAVVDEPVMYRREPGLPRDIFGLQEKYDANIAKQVARRTGNN